MANIEEALFQFQKVRLTGGILLGLTMIIIRFNSRRCDWQRYYGRFWSISFEVSIPEGAIDSQIDYLVGSGRRGFNSRRCDWQTETFLKEYIDEKFQFQKVRLTGTLYERIAYEENSFNSRRCDWQGYLPPLDHVSGARFNSRRCDWQTLFSRAIGAVDWVSIPEGAIDRLILLSLMVVVFSFNSRRCDWQTNRQRSISKRN